jgi:chaperonin GroES
LAQILYNWYRKIELLIKKYKREMSVKIRPLGDRVVIEPKEAEQKTASGIIIPDSAQEKPQQGTVVAVGSADEIELKPGEVVLYGKYAGTEVEIEGVKYLVMKQSEILAAI